MNEPISEIIKVISKLLTTRANAAHNLEISFVGILLNKVEFPLKVFSDLCYNCLCLRSPVVRGEVVHWPLPWMFSSYLLLRYIRQWLQETDMGNRTFAVKIQFSLINILAASPRLKNKYIATQANYLLVTVKGFYRDCKFKRCKQF